MEKKATRTLPLSGKRAILCARVRGPVDDDDDDDDDDGDDGSDGIDHQRAFTPSPTDVY